MDNFWCEFLICIVMFSIFHIAVKTAEVKQNHNRRKKYRRRMTAIAEDKKGYEKWRKTVYLEKDNRRLLHMVNQTVTIVNNIPTKV